MNSDKEEIVFCHREFNSIGAAVGEMAAELAKRLQPVLTKQDREGLARIMFKSAGSIRFGRVSLTWHHADSAEGVKGMGDLLYHYAEED